MTSHGCYLCLLLLSVILIKPSKAGCWDYFKKADWKTKVTDDLPDNIPVNIINATKMNKPEDIIVCSISENCNRSNETCFLLDCFKDIPTCKRTDQNTNVSFYHFMCLTDIAKRLHDETKALKPTAEEVCKVYEKVCKRDSPNPAAKTTTPTACTTTAPTTATTTKKTTSRLSAATTPKTATKNKTTSRPSAATTTTTATKHKTTSRPSAATTRTTEATKNKTTSRPSAATTRTTEATKNKTTSRPSAATTPKTATKNKTTSRPSATKNKTTSRPSATKNKTTSRPSATTTATTTEATKNPQLSAAAVSITTPSSPMNLQQKYEPLQGESAEKEKILHIIIGVLIFTNFLCPVGVYMYMRRLQRSNERNTFRSDIGEGSILLTTPESSIIINSPETTIIESPCPHRTHL
ncbi:hypothetical protein ACER0C_014741 [Sarotherodon galilaeus]